MTQATVPERPGAAAQAPPAPQLGTTTLAVTAGAALGVVLFVFFGLLQGLVYILGIGLGVTLYHARFGFTSAFRQFIAVGQGTTLRAHMLMLAAASLLFAPLLAYGVTLFGAPLHGYVFPIGLSVVFGGFIFGLGMQLGGACASGTLYSVGSGQTSILITIFGFVIGSVWGAYDFGFWTQSALNWKTLSLAATSWGYPGGLLIQFAILASIVLATYAIERRKRPPLRARPPSVAGWARILRGAWPLWVGALALALLNAATLWLSGKPWGITSAFALWGSKALATVGVGVEQWYYWSGPHQGQLGIPILTDRTSVMNFGIIFGAMAAASYGGNFRIARGLPWRTVLARIVGGIMMGYGARIAYGCNIGAYFGGIASFSVHGWVWGIVALAGTLIGIRLRPLLGLHVPKPSDRQC